MNPELQTLVDRIEWLEQHGRGQRWTAILALVAALAAIAVSVGLETRRAAPLEPEGGGRFSTIAANRILLRDADGRVAGGFEVDRNGTVRLVLGRTGDSSSVRLEAQRNGISHLTLQGVGGEPLAALVGSRQPGLTLGGPGLGNSSLTADDASGLLVIRDVQGRLRFRAP